MVFLILIGASVFSLVFRGFGGDELIEELLLQLPGGVIGAMLVVMLVMFLLGFVLDFIEITFVVVPIVGPILAGHGAGSGLAGHHDRHQSADIIPDTAIRLCPVLPARGRPGNCHHRRAFTAASCPLFLSS